MQLPAGERLQCGRDRAAALLAVLGISRVVSAIVIVAGPLEELRLSLCFCCWMAVGARRRRQMAEQHHEAVGDGGVRVDVAAYLVDGEADEVVEVGHLGDEAQRAVVVSASAARRGLAREADEEVDGGSHRVFRGRRIVQGGRERAQGDVCQLAQGKPTSSASVRSR